MDEQLTRKKPYKAKAPFKTINQIRNILESLDIFTIESHYNYSNNTFYCCRLQIVDDKSRNVRKGSNGKGLTIQYALASAYAEFIERLQNLILLPIPLYATKHHITMNGVNTRYHHFLEKNNLVLDFLYGPDEKYLSMAETVEQCYDILQKILPGRDKIQTTHFFQNEAKLDETIFVPYYSVMEKQTRELPISLIYTACGTNGMCAGNTTTEAVIQGICEIFERYALKRIIMDEITPPTIPLEYFNGTSIYNHIKQLEKEKNIRFFIKDCSLDMGLPVIGVLMIDYQMQTYAFKLGSDPSPITSVERCITELYQGKLDFKLNPLHFSIDPYSANPLEDREKVKSRMYLNIFINGRGIWPTNLFGPKPDYEFKGFQNNTAKSDKEDLEYLVKKIEEHGYSLFIREQSFLDFPTLHVYIPGMSEATILSENDFANKLNFNNSLPILFNIKKSSPEEIKQLALCLDNIYHYFRSTGVDVINDFILNANKDLDKMSIDLLLVMLFYSIGNYEKAFEYMKKHTVRTQIPYYNCIRDYLKLKIENYSDKEMIKNLSILHGEKLTKEVVEDFADPKKIFQHSPLPSCFSCDTCDIAQDCQYFHVLTIYKKLHDIRKKKNLDQGALRELFQT